ncbi:MAG: ArsR family transcriptional regulator [Acidobacteria bacterium]|nr:ArsR family transcriptional regulator [Acidobacteriota bacterium]
MERRSPAVDVLLAKTKQRLLSAVLLQPNRAWYLSELARHLNVPPSSVQRELTQFVRAGIFAKRQDGNRVYFQADPTCPIFPELSSILTKTVGLADVVRQALAPLATELDLAFIYGSIATSKEHSSSDVDLMLIGAATLADLAIPLRSLESSLARSVNPTVYSTEEFRRRVAAKNHFLLSVLETKLLFILGTDNDLARLIELAKSSAA